MPTNPFRRRSTVDSPTDQLKEIQEKLTKLYTEYTKLRSEQEQAKAAVDADKTNMKLVTKSAAALRKVSEKMADIQEQLPFVNAARSLLHLPELTDIPIGYDVTSAELPLEQQTVDPALEANRKQLVAKTELLLGLLKDGASLSGIASMALNKQAVAKADSAKMQSLEQVMSMLSKLMIEHGRQLTSQEYPASAAVDISVLRPEDKIFYEQLVSLEKKMTQGTQGGIALPAKLKSPELPQAKSPEPLPVLASAAAASPEPVKEPPQAPVVKSPVPVAKSPEPAKPSPAPEQQAVPGDAPLVTPAVVRPAAAVAAPPPPPAAAAAPPPPPPPPPAAPAAKATLFQPKVQTARETLIIGAKDPSAEQIPQIQQGTLVMLQQVQGKWYLWTRKKDEAKRVKKPLEVYFKMPVIKDWLQKVCKQAAGQQILTVESENWGLLNKFIDVVIGSMKIESLELALNRLAGKADPLHMLDATKLHENNSAAVSSLTELHEQKQKEALAAEGAEAEEEEFDDDPAPDTTPGMTNG